MSGRAFSFRWLEAGWVSDEMRELGQGPPSDGELLWLRVRAVLQLLLQLHGINQCS